MGMAVTGIGSVCALGRGVPAFWSGLAAGRDGIETILRFSTEGIKCKIAGMVPHRNNPSSSSIPSWKLNIEFATDAAREAWEMSGLDMAKISPDRVALVMGTSLEEYEVSLHKITEQVAANLGIRGPAITVSSACTSATHAFGIGMDLLRQGFADVVIAGGSDVLTPILQAGFNALGALSTQKCAPFSHPFGTTLGEGAGFLVLETVEGAGSRGATVHGVMEGYGLAADAYHETRPEPTGAGVARAINGALKHANISHGKIGYVNAHGTGTPANDPAEWCAIQTVFGESATRIPVSSTKSFIGHAQGAAGALETIATLLSMQNQVVPPTLHFTIPRKNGPTDPVFTPLPRSHSYRYAVCTNSAFGGANAAVVIGLSGTPQNESVPRAKEVYVVGIGALGAHGTSLNDLLPVIEGGCISNFGRTPEFSLSGLVPNIDMRGLDPSSRFLTAVAAMALSDAELGAKRTLRNRVGLVMGVNRVSEASVQELQASIRENGLPLLSANAFSRMVLNAPVGCCSKLLGLGGPISTLSTGDGSSLAALVYAADMLQTREDADVLIAGGLDEWTLDPKPNQGEGAACAVLANRPTPDGSESITITGWGLAGPGQLEVAAGSALKAANLEPESMGAVFGAGLKNFLPAHRHIEPEHALGYAEASTCAFAFVAAVLWLRLGRAENVLVANGRGNSATCALILTRRKKHEYR